MEKISERQKNSYEKLGSGKIISKFTQEYFEREAINSKLIIIFKNFYYFGIRFSQILDIQVKV